MEDINEVIKRISAEVSKTTNDCIKNLVEFAGYKINNDKDFEEVQKIVDKMTDSGLKIAVYKLDSQNSTSIHLEHKGSMIAGYDFITQIKEDGFILRLIPKGLLKEEE